MILKTNLVVVTNITNTKRKYIKCTICRQSYVLFYQTLFQLYIFRHTFIIQYKVIEAQLCAKPGL